jgi:tRNA(adenine34) deaminase
MVSAMDISMANRTKQHRWSGDVKTESTYPPKGLFTKDADTVARTLASKKVSPKGPSSGMRMLTFFINRAGRGLSKKQRAELQKAKSLLSEKVKQARERRERDDSRSRRRAA